MRPNILYLHTHDAGRYIEPYGYAVRTPNLMRLARESTVFRHAHCAAPTCTPSRVAMLTGQSPHSAGCLGLAHRGHPMQHTERHLVNFLAGHGYRTALSGIQHEHTDPRALGYQQLLKEDHPQVNVEEAAVAFLQEKREQPFFLSVGWADTHRTFAEPIPEDDEPFCRPPEPLPDNAVTRRDMAAYRRAVSNLDQRMGRVLQAIDDQGLRNDTLVICTTDHGIPFPMMKCNLTTHGTGVFLMLRWPGRIQAQVTDALVSQIDVFPTLCDLLDLPRPDWLQGNSLGPVLADPFAEANEELFGEVTFHAAFEPMRSARTKRWLYIKRWDKRLRPVGTNCDVSLSRTHLVEQDWPRFPYAGEELYDCEFDPIERRNLAADPDHADVRDEMRHRLKRWMERTNDPLLKGVEALPEDSRVADPEDFTSPVGGAGPAYMPPVYEQSRGK